MTANRTSCTRNPHRLTALLLAFVCLWISGGAVLHHSDDDFAPLLTFAAGHDTLHHAAPALPSVPCAACQWEQSLPTIHSVGMFVTALPFSQITFAAALLPALHLRSFDYVSLRAPPRLRA